MIEGEKQNSSVVSVVKTRISSVTADHVIYRWTFMASCVLGITGIQVDLNLELTAIHFPLTQPQSLFFLTPTVPTSVIYPAAAVTHSCCWCCEERLRVPAGSSHSVSVRLWLPASALSLHPPLFSPPHSLPDLPRTNTKQTAHGEEVALCVLGAQSSLTAVLTFVYRPPIIPDRCGMTRDGGHWVFLRQRRRFESLMSGPWLLLLIILIIWTKYLVSTGNCTQDPLLKARQAC